MNKYRLLLLGLIAGMLLVFGIFLIGSIQNVLAVPSLKNPLDVAVTEVPSSFDDSDEILPSDFSEEALSPKALPTPIPGETLVYFVTTDSDATATVVYLYNTDSVAHTVALRGYSYSGVLGYSLNINIAASSFLRLSSDSIAAAPPPSWATPPPIITNFTDFTFFASLSLPHGVKAEGYVLYNPGTGTVDPRLDQGAIPLRFSTDPATLFIPVVQNNP
jgi:hypothetical protein